MAAARRWPIWVVRVVRVARVALVALVVRPELAMRAGSLVRAELVARAVRAVLVGAEARDGAGRRDGLV
jgi:hypothetical protein